MVLHVVLAGWCLVGVNTINCKLLLIVCELFAMHGDAVQGLFHTTHTSRHTSLQCLHVFPTPTA